MERRAFLTASAAVLCGCEGAPSSAAQRGAPGARPAQTSAQPVAVAQPGASAKLRPDEPVDARFEGCAGACGSKAEVPAALIVAQPGAKPGDHTHCPVSGAVFQVEGSSARRVHGDGFLYFCCAPCATYFGEHVEEVLAHRGMV